MNAPLHDIRVVEIASYVAAPAAGALLADLGAEVLKVETPQGELLRHSRPRLLGYRSALTQAPHFHMDNRGKRSLALDLSRAAARRALLQVVERADVVLSNMLPARLKKYGLDAASLRARRPALIVATLSGYGERGAEADAPAFDYTAFWARTGFMHSAHDAGAAPAFLRPGAGDHAAALALCTGILSALRMREQTGAGQEVAVNLMHTGFYLQGNDAAQALSTQQDPPRHDRARPRNPLWNHYATRDERWLFLVMIDSQPYWPLLCRAIEREDLLRDERYASPAGRYHAQEELTATLAETFRTRTLAAWERALKKHRLIWAPVRTLLEASRDPQALANEVFSDVPHADGAMRSVAPPVRLSAHPMRGERPAPELGADTAAILREAGVREADIAAALSDAAPRAR